MSSFRAVLVRAGVRWEAADASYFTPIMDPSSLTCAIGSFFASNTSVPFLIVHLISFLFLRLSSQ